jgi:hypothetical protein
MAKKRNLNGLPNVLIQQYFSTMFYCNKGYMADWIWNAAKGKNVSDIQIDIINKTITPKDLQISSLTGYLVTLQQTIKKELVSNGFSDDFIVKAKFEIYICPETKPQKIFGVLATIEDKDGNIYRSKPYTEMAYNDFLVFKPTLEEKLMKYFNIK